jgi:hypothetical protein
VTFLGNSEFTCGQPWGALMKELAPFMKNHVLSIVQEYKEKTHTDIEMSGEVDKAPGDSNIPESTTEGGPAGDVGAGDVGAGDKSGDNPQADGRPLAAVGSPAAVGAQVQADQPATGTTPAPFATPAIKTPAPPASSTDKPAAATAATTAAATVVAPSLPSDVDATSISAAPTTSVRPKPRFKSAKGMLVNL